MGGATTFTPVDDDVETFTICMAGAVAEQWIVPNGGLRISPTDMKWMDKAFAALAQARHVTRQSLESDARKSIVAKRPLICEVARALMKRQSLSGDDLRAICGS